jgi:hypothetical protein
VDWNVISDGLTLSLFGILTTFLALGLFIFSMFLLRWLFPTEKRRRPSLQVPVTVPAVVEPMEDVASIEEEALAAAIAAAMVLRQAVPSLQNDVASEAAAAAAAAWWLKQHQNAGQTLVAVPQATVPRTGLGTRLESRRGRWWQPMSGEN